MHPNTVTLRKRSRDTKGKISIQTGAAKLNTQGFENLLNMPKDLLREWLSAFRSLVSTGFRSVVCFSVSDPVEEFLFTTPASYQLQTGPTFKKNKGNPIRSKARLTHKHTRGTGLTH